MKLQGLLPHSSSVLSEVAASCTPSSTSELLLGIQTSKKHGDQDSTQDSVPPGLLTLPCLPLGSSSSPSLPAPSVTLSRRNAGSDQTLKTLWHLWSCLSGPLQEHHLRAQLTKPCLFSPSLDLKLPTTSPYSELLPAWKSGSSSPSFYTRAIQLGQNHEAILRASFPQLLPRAPM